MTSKQAKARATVARGHTVPGRGGVWARVRRDHLVHWVLLGRRPVPLPNDVWWQRAGAYLLLPIFASAKGDLRLIVRLCVVFALTLLVLVLAAAGVIWLWQAAAVLGSLLPLGVAL